VARQTLGEAVHHAGSLVERADDAITHCEVVLDEVELGRSGLGKVDPVRVGHLDDLVVDLDLDRG
jgi:hypothetical protein